MAEIKRFEGSNVFNKPIGVVRPSSAGVEAAQALSRAGTAMFQASYEQEVIKQKELGQQTGLTMNLRDTEQNLVIRSIPSGLSPVAARSAQGVVDRRYVESLNLDMKNRAANLRNQFENDPDGFDVAYTEYINETAKNAGRYSQQAREIGLTYAGQNYAALTADKLEFEDRIDFNNMFANLTQEIDEIGVLTAAGQTSAFANARFNELVKDGGSIDQLVAKHGDRLGVTQGPELKNRVRTAFYGGQIQNLATQLEVFHREQNPFTSESTTTQYMRYVQDALRKGNVSSLPPAVAANLDQLGFNDAFLQRPGMARVRDTLASKLAVIEGNREEIFNSNKAAVNLRRIGMNVESGRPVSSTDASTFLTAAKIPDAYALADLMPELFREKEDGTPGFAREDLEPVRQVIFGRGGMPQQLLDMLGDPAIVQDIVARDPSMLRTLTNVYRQATITNQGGFQQRTYRGLDDSAIVFWNTIDAYSNSVRTMDTNAFFAKYTEIQGMEKKTRDTILNSNFKAAGIKNGGLAEFIYSSTGMDRNDAAQFAFMESYADELIIMHGHEKAAKILKRTSEDLFVDSEIVFGDFPTRYDPNAAFPDADERNVFADQVVSQLYRHPEGKNMRLGRDVFLAPDPREGPVLPVYTLVDRDGIALVVNGEPLQVSSNQVLATRAARTKQDRAKLQADAIEAFEARLRFERAVTAARTEEADDIDTMASQLRFP
tara:strand:+ start:2398 stop:4545 length:2148 start_codon:yes stop_codon:yes gene_type:complete